ncbi:MAG: hypothetical protein KBT27_09325 [Prevotellaceae bacterium]|nr:hypothetical protein [Candidatus Faecinaster equi]
MYIEPEIETALIKSEEDIACVLYLKRSEDLFNFRVYIEFNQMDAKTKSLVVTVDVFPSRILSNSITKRYELVYFGTEYNMNEIKNDIVDIVERRDRRIR